MFSGESIKGGSMDLELTEASAWAESANRETEKPSNQIDLAARRRNVVGGAGHATHNAPFAHDHAEPVEDDDKESDDPSGLPNPLQRTDTSTTAMTTIGVFRVPRSHRTPSCSFWWLWALEVVLSTIVAIVGVVDGITDLAPLENTAN